MIITVKRNALQLHTTETNLTKIMSNEKTQWKKETAVKSHLQQVKIFFTKLNWCLVIHA